MNDWLNIAPAVVNRVNRRWIDIVPSSTLRRIYAQLEFPAFSVDDIAWLGSSYIILQYRFLDLPNGFIFPKITKPPGANYCLCVRYSSVDNLVVTRYKLWDGVGERLFFPLYIGQFLPKDAIFEVWSTVDDEVSSAGFTLLTNLLTDPLDCCDQASMVYQSTPVPIPLLPWIQQPQLDPFSAQFNSSGGLNQNSLITGHSFESNTSWAVLGWVLLSNLSAESYMCSSWSDGGNNEAWFLGFDYPSQTRWYAAIWNNNGVYDIIYGHGSAIAINTWHFIALVNDRVNNKIRLYTDGFETEIIPAAYNVKRIAQMELGARSGKRNFVGRLDEWQILSRALTKVELDVLYNGGVPLPYARLTDAQKVNLESYQDFADSTDGVSPIDGSPYKVNIGKSKHPGGWDFQNTTAFSGGVLITPYVSQANRATLYP